MAFWYAVLGLGHGGSAAGSSGSAGVVERIASRRQGVARVRPYFDPTPKVLTLNSTTSPLSASGVFTGEWERVLDLPSLIATAATDKNGTLNVEFSSDGENVDRTVSYSITGGTPAANRVVVTHEFARVTFTDTSSSNQTYLRLVTYLTWATS